MPADERASTGRPVVGLVAAFVGVLIFSFSIPMTSLALRGFQALPIAVGRAAIAGSLALVVLLVVRVPWPGRRFLRPLLVTAIGVVVGWPVLTTLALQRTTSAHAAVIAAGLPIATAVFAVVRGGERPPRAFWVASVVGTVAVVVFALSRGGGRGEDLLADVLMLGAVALAALGYAEGAVLTRSMPGWQVVSWTLVVCLPATLPLAVVGLHSSMSVRDPTPAAWVGMLYLAVFSMYLGFFAWYRGLADLGVARGSQVQLLQPLLTLLWSVLLLGETVGLDTLVAAFVVLGAVAWTQRTRAPAEVEATD